MVFTVNEYVADTLLEFAEIARPRVIRTEFTIYPIAGFISQCRSFVKTGYSSGYEFDEVLELAWRISQYLF